MRDGGAVEIVERELSDPWEAFLASPVAGADAGVVVLTGSSGRIDRERARLFAREGVAALAIRWFGGPGQPPGICEIPLETFVVAVDRVVETGVRRVGVLGVSKGAESALLTAVRDPRVDLVVAVSPTSRVWSNVGPGRDGKSRPQRSSWTWRGRPLPFVPMDDSWTPHQDHGPVAIRDWYELSERTHADLLAPAAIPIEEARADVLLVAGGDDAMWPSLRFAEELRERRRDLVFVARADAGHRPRFPGESPAPDSPRHLYGGTTEADALLGAAAWPQLLDRLR